MTTEPASGLGTQIDLQGTAGETVPADPRTHSPPRSSSRPASSAKADPMRRYGVSVPLVWHSMKRLLHSVGVTSLTVMSRREPWV